MVAPFVGAGIEINIPDPPKKQDRVAPFVGAGIEIHLHPSGDCHQSTSHPSWVRGLK